jgi:hypothetical protein
MSIADQMQKIRDTLDVAQEDAEKFDKGNNAAGTRVRKAALEAKKGLDAIRKDVSAAKNARKG